MPRIIQSKYILLRPFTGVGTSRVIDALSDLDMPRWPNLVAIAFLGRTPWCRTGSRRAEG